MAYQLLPQLSTQLSYDESVVSNEIELLTNIYDQKELIVKEINGVVTLEVHITPRTADDADQQFVYVDVTMELNKEYPLLPPVMTITCSRGLSDAHISSIHSDVQLMAEEKVGGPMLFDLLEHVRDCLTDQNKPCGSCSICLCMFEEEDRFTRTDCYHYFHVDCFARYIHHMEQVDDSVDGIPGRPVTSGAESNCVKCPVCRISLANSSSCFQAINNITVISYIDEKDIVYHPSEADVRRMKEWESIMEKQRAQGGIIDHSVDPHEVDWNWTPAPVTTDTDTVTTSVAMATNGIVVSTPVTVTTETSGLVSLTTVKSTPSVATHTTQYYYHRPRTKHNYYHKKTRHKHY